MPELLDEGVRFLGYLKKNRSRGMSFTLSLLKLTSSTSDPTGQVFPDLIYGRGDMLSC